MVAEPGKPHARRFTLIAAILLGAIAIAQAVRAFYGFDVQVEGFHIPTTASWAAAVLLGIVAVLTFREANT